MKEENIAILLILIFAILLGVAAQIERPKEEIEDATEQSANLNSEVQLNPISS